MGQNGGYFPTSREGRKEAKNRQLGIVYTPDWLIKEMIRWASEYGKPARVIDAGAGTGRFTFAAAEAFPEAEIVAIEVDPCAVRSLRTAVCAFPHRSRIKVLNRDYLYIRSLPVISGQTLFIGNPPYVRHHLIDQAKKRLYLSRAREFSLPGNTKAGLHLHFFLQARKLARQGDYGILVTAAERIHADYGETLRGLLLDGMGGLSIDTFDAKDLVFPDFMTTATIVCFEVGRKINTIGFSHVRNREGSGGASSP